jgi:hypothetical protein
MFAFRANARAGELHIGSNRPLALSPTQSQLVINAFGKPVAMPVSIPSKPR